MKKIMLAFLFLFCSCSVPASAGETVLRFSWWGGAERHEATLTAIRAFEAANPDITIKAEYMGWDGYLERLSTQIGSQSEADVMQIDWAWLATFSKDGNGFYDITKLRDKINLGEYEQKWLNTGTVQGKLNALPVSYTAMVLVYNKNTFAKAGLPYPKTWDELFEAGRLFKERLGAEYFPLDLNRDERFYFTHAYIFQKTGKQFLDPGKMEVGLTREELIDWLSCYKELLDSGAVMRPSIRAAIGGDNEKKNQEFKEFIEGYWAGFCAFDAALANRVGTIDVNDYEVGPYPLLPEAKCSGRIGRPSMLFAISRHSKHPEAAGRFIEFMLTSETAAKILKSTRGALLANTAHETLVRENLITPLNKVAMDQVLGVDSYAPNPYYEHARTKHLMDEVFEEIGYGKCTVEQGADRLLSEGNRIIKRVSR